MATKGLLKLLAENKGMFLPGDVDPKHTKFSTGFIGLNAAIGDIEGIPGGSIIQFVANEKRGKTTLALQTLAQSQKTSNLRQVEVPIDKNTISIANAAYLDFERSYSRDYAELLGVDVGSLLVIKPTTAEAGLDTIETLLSEGMQFIIVDSVPMMMPKSEEDKNYDDNIKMASIASLLTRAMPRLVMLADNADALLIMINQFRAETNQMSQKSKKRYGAFSLHYVSKVILELERTKNTIHQADVQILVEKTKFGKEKGISALSLVYGHGFDRNQHIIDFGVEHEIVDKSGAWYYYDNERYKAQGIKEAKNTFPIDEIEATIIHKLAGE